MRLSLTHRLSIYNLISIPHAPCLSLRLSTPLWVHPGCARVHESHGQTDLGSDSSSLYNDSDPSLFIKSCWPLQLHIPLPLLTDPHCIQALSTALWNQTRKWPQRGIQKGVCVCVCVCACKYMAKNIFWLNWLNTPHFYF